MSAAQVSWDSPSSAAPQVKWDDEQKEAPQAPQASTLSNLGLSEGPDVAATPSLSSIKSPHPFLHSLGESLTGQGDGSANESGVQSIGRGLRGAGQAIASLPGKAVDDLSGGHLPIIHELAEGIKSTGSEAAQVPGAIHDINQSPDPLGTYAKVAQDTAGQGAGQALTALATEGAIRGAPSMGRIAKPAVGATLRTASDIIGPDVTGIISPRFANAQRLMGRIGRGMSGSEAPLVYRDATALNKVPFAGEEIPSESLVTRDATHLNKIPHAGEEIGEETALAPLKAPGKLGGRLVLTPEEAQQASQIQKIAKVRASQRGMQYAGGMRPSGAKIAVP